MMHPITTLRCRLLTHFLAVQLETWYHDVNVSFKLLSCLEHRKIISHLAISSCGCQNSGPSPPLSLMFRSIGKSDFNTNLRPDCAWRRRSCRWPATDLVKCVPSTFGAPDFSFEFSTRIYSRWNPNKTTTSKVYLQSLTHHNNKKIDNIILSPTSLWAHLPQPFRPCLFPSHRPDPHGEGNTFAIQDFEAITLHSLRSVPHHTTMDLLSYQKHRFRIRYNKCDFLRCLF